jgi:hypothetical protein
MACPLRDSDWLSKTEESSMNPDPTITISWDYLVELSDDGTQSDQQDPEVIIIPPSPNIPNASPTPEQRQ